MIRGSRRPLHRQSRWSLPLSAPVALRGYEIMKLICQNLKSEKGYTLVELVLCMLLLGIMGTAAIPKDPGLGPISLDAAAQKIKTDIRYAQNMATTTGDSYGFRVTGNTTYQIYNATTGGVAKSPTTNQNMNEDLSDNFRAVRFNQANYQITFDSAGKPSSGGGSLVTLQDGTNANVVKQVSVTTTSGYVSVL